MTFEPRIRRALSQVDDYQPSPDLYARVVRSISQDREYRRRRAVVVAGVLAFAAALVGLVAVAGTVDDGAWRLPRWATELAGLSVSVVIVAVLGPAVRRSGRHLADGLFEGESGARPFLKLLDLAYYMVFAGVILTGVRLTRLSATPPVGQLLEETTSRVAVVLAVMGVLHAVTVVALPLTALLRSVTRWRAAHREAGTRSAHREALLADKVVTVGLVAGGVVLLLAMTFFLVMLAGDFLA